jgi:MFS family permease
VMMLMSPVTGRLIGRYGGKVPMFCGAVLIAAGYGISVALMRYAWGIMAGAAVSGAGVGLAYAAMPSLIMAAVPASETAAANGLNALMRSIGTSLASAVIGAVLAHLTSRLGSSVFPSQDAFRASFLIGCGGAIAAALVVLAVPKQRVSLTFPQAQGQAGSGAPPSSPSGQAALDGSSA